LSPRHSLIAKRKQKEINTEKSLRLFETCYDLVVFFLSFRISKMSKSKLTFKSRKYDDDVGFHQTLFKISITNHFSYA